MTTPSSPTAPRLPRSARCSASCTARSTGCRRTTGWPGLRGELGVGARVGVVRKHGEALQESQLTRGSLTRLWLGPAVGIAVTRRVALRADVELGVVAAGATARDLGEPVAAISGAWTSLGLAAVIEL